MYHHDQALKRRNEKVRRAINVTPIWMVFDEFRAAEESFYFDLVYQHSMYGWIQQRFKYDAFNDVLYHFGQKQISEQHALEIQDTTPYIEGEFTIAVPVDPRPRSSAAE